MLNFFKKFTLFEKLLLVISIIVLIATGIIFNSSIVTIICTVLFVLAIMLIAKGNYLGQIIGIVVTILYSYISYKNRYYGEIIINIGIVLPLYILGIISWIKHENKETKTVKINQIRFKEWLVALVLSIGVYFGIYYLLKSQNTNLLIVSTLSVVASLFGMYLNVRRSSYSFLLFIINDIILIFLWGIPSFKGDYTLVPLFINPIINLFNDSYGLYNWKKNEKLQK